MGNSSVGSRGLASGRIVFWVIALVVIGALGLYIYKKKQPVVIDNKPAPRLLAAYLAEQHREAWAAGDASTFQAKTQADIYEWNKTWFGQDTDFAELNGSGVVFKGAQEVRIPGPPTARSAVFRLETDGTVGTAGVRTTLFLQKYLLEPDDEGNHPLKIKTSYTLKNDPSLSGAPPIFVYRQGGLIFYLLTETPGGYDLVKKAFGMPEPVGDY